MRPVGRVPSNIEDHGDRVYLVPSNFRNWLPFLAGHCGKPTVLPHACTSLLNLRGRRKEEKGTE